MNNERDPKNSMLIPLDEVIRINNAVKNARVPYRRLNAILSVCRKIREKYKDDGSRFSSLTSAKDIWKRIKASPYTFTLVSYEFRCLPQALFCKFRQEDERLCFNKTVMKRVQLLLSEQSSNYSERLVQGFFQYYPDPKKEDFSRLNQTVLTIARNSLQTQPLIERGFFSETPAAIVAQQIDDPENWLWALNEMSSGLIDDMSAFAQKVWVCLCPWISETMKETVSHPEKTSQALEKVRNMAFIPGEAKLLYPLEAERFTKCVISSYLTGTGNLPTDDQVTLFTNFFSKLFGDIFDSQYHGQWLQLSKELRDLFEHWRKGETLNKVFDYVSRKVRYKSNGQRMWRNRKEFWMSYWNDGLLGDTELFSGDWYVNEHLDFPAHFMDGLEEKKYVISMTIDSIQIYEVSHNGKLRIGFVSEKEECFWGRKRPTTYWQLQRFGVGITHDPYDRWQDQAKSEIRARRNAHIDVE